MKIILNKRLFSLPLLPILLPVVVMFVACTASEETNQQGSSTNQELSANKEPLAHKEPLAQKEPSAQKEEAQKQNVLMLRFQESEPGIDPYTTRMLVSNEYMRMDDGKDSDDFTLFDRKQKTIYSVTHENQRILLILNQPTKVTWVSEFKLEEKITEDMNAPEISGKKPHQVEFLVNGKSCRHIAAVPGLLDQALKALSEFRQVLATEHIRNLDKTPVEMQDPCFLAYEVQYPDKILQAGFPVQEQDYTGRTRVLLDYNSEFTVNSALFQLPQEYQQFSSSAVE